MKLHNIVTYLLITAVSLILFSGDAFCRLNLPQQQQQSVIKGQDHEALKDFLASFDRNRSNGFTSDQVRRILLEALPEVYRNGCSDMVSHWGTEAGGTAGMSVKVLYGEAKKQEGPLRALLAYSCFSRLQQYGNKFRDERLAVLVVDRSASRLSMVPNDKDCDDCSQLAQITLDKVVRLPGKTVVGLSFLKSTENPCCAGPPAWKEERVNFYVMKDDGVRPAGSVLRKREQYEHDDVDGDVETVYTAGLVLKKDMKGNIVGILSPYKIKKGGKAAGKGMVRFNWNAEKEEFVRE